MNHLPVDTQVMMYNLENTREKYTDFRMLYTKEFIEKLDPELEIKIKG
jgi:hypothetical protein